MAESTSEDGSMESNMEKEHLLLQMDKRNKENGRME